MNPQEFCSLYLEYFGNKAPLPIAVYYSDNPDKETKGMTGCMFKQFHRADEPLPS